MHFKLHNLHALVLAKRIMSWHQFGTMFGTKGFCLIGLRLYVPVNNFSVMSGRSNRFLGITSTFLEGKCIFLEDTTQRHE